MARISYGGDMFSPVKCDNSFDETVNHGRDSEIFFEQWKEMLKDNKKKDISKENSSIRKKLTDDAVNSVIKSSDALLGDVSAKSTSSAIKSQHAGITVRKKSANQSNSSVRDITFQTPAAPVRHKSVKDRSKKGSSNLSVRPESSRGNEFQTSRTGQSSCASVPSLPSVAEEQVVKKTSPPPHARSTNLSHNKKAEKPATDSTSDKLSKRTSISHQASEVLAHTRSTTLPHNKKSEKSATDSTLSKHSKQARINQGAEELPHARSITSSHNKKVAKPGTDSSTDKLSKQESIGQVSEDGKSSSSCILQEMLSVTSNFHGIEKLTVTENKALAECEKEIPLSLPGLCSIEKSKVEDDCVVAGCFTENIPLSADGDSANHLQQIQTSIIEKTVKEAVSFEFDGIRQMLYLQQLSLIKHMDKNFMASKDNPGNVEVLVSVIESLMEENRKLKQIIAHYNM